MNWEDGRQKGAYKKMLLWSKKFKSWGFDSYLLKFPSYSQIPIHVDPVEGYKHFRFNLVYKGLGKFTCERVIFNFWERIILFRPDEFLHSVKNGSTERRVLSIGIVVKK